MRSASRRDSICIQLHASTRLRGKLGCRQPAQASSRRIDHGAGLPVAMPGSIRSARYSGTLPAGTGLAGIPQMPHDPIRTIFSVVIDFRGSTSRFPMQPQIYSMTHMAEHPSSSRGSQLSSPIPMQAAGFPVQSVPSVHGSSTSTTQLPPRPSNRHHRQWCSPRDSSRPHWCRW